MSASRVDCDSAIVETWDIFIASPRSRQESAEHIVDD